MNGDKNRKAMLWPIMAALALAGCGDKQAMPGGNEAASNDVEAGREEAGPGQAPAAAATPGPPRPDMDKPLSTYPELQSGQQIMLLYIAASKLPPDFGKLAEQFSQEYRNTSDGFRRNDLLQSIKPQLERQIAAVAAAPYAWMLVSGATVRAYDFERRGFPVSEFDGDSSRYFNDNYNYRLSWANGSQVQFVRVPDEAKAREMEALRNSNSLKLKIYFFAQSADLNSQTVKAYVTRVQIYDLDGRLVLEYGPEGG